MTPTGPERHVFDCDQAFEKLFDFLDGEVEASDAAAVRSHLAKCRHCFEAAEFERRFLVMLEQAKRHGGCPEALRKRVLEALKAEGLRA